MFRVAHSAEVATQRGKRDWSICVDIVLGRRAVVFIWNGFSSLTTERVALRFSDEGGLHDHAALRSAKVLYSNNLYVLY